MKMVNFSIMIFARCLTAKRIRLDELRAEMIAQVEKTRELAGAAFSHVDFHMGLHRLPRLYGLFLEIAENFGAGRIRTHVYRVGMESRYPRLRHCLHLLERPGRLLKFAWNHILRKQAQHRALAMPDRRVEMTAMADQPGMIVLENYLSMLRNMPHGINEFVAHPGYVDYDLRRWSTYHEPRSLELQILLSSRFRQALASSDIKLFGYRDIPGAQSRAVRSANRSASQAVVTQK